MAVHNYIFGNMWLQKLAFRYILIYWNYGIDRTRFVCVWYVVFTKTEWKKSWIVNKEDWYQKAGEFHKE